MATANSTGSQSIRRYLVVRRKFVEKAFCNRYEALAFRDVRNVKAPQFRYRVVECLFQPNETVKAFGIGRFDNMLKDFTSGPYGCHVDCIGSKDDLIACGVAGEYMFDQLGDQNSRQGSTEYGDNFHLIRRSQQRYKLTLWMEHKPRQPWGIGNIKYSDTDISDILEKISAR